VGDPMQIEQLELLAEAGGQLVLALPFGKLLLGPDPAAGVGDKLPLSRWLTPNDRFVINRIRYFWAIGT
jgi:hypothetical protein